MDKGLKRTLTGIYIVAGVIFFILFYVWLSGKLALRATYDIKVYLPDITWLRIGDPVIIYGIEKGKVKSFRIEGDKVLVILAIDKEIRLPEDSRISIRLVNYLGSDRYIKIVPGKSDRFSNVFYGFDETLIFETMTAKLDSITSVFDNLTIPDLNKLGDRLIRSMEQSAREIPQTLKGTSERINLLISKMDILIDSLNSITEQQGTVGKLLKSDELYQEILATNRSLKELIEDIKANPKKYLEIKIF